MDARDRIAEFRMRFATSLAGRWTEASGTFGSVMNEVWEFYPDGTGRRLDTGPFGRPRRETRFEWKNLGERIVEVNQIQYLDLQSAPVSHCDEDEDDRTVIHYDFIEVSTDAGVEIGMCDVMWIGSDRPRFFWNGLAPLAYRGSVLANP